MQVSEFFEPIGMSHRNFPWARIGLLKFSVMRFFPLDTPGLRRRNG
eukprot:COSAG02_NODE_39_length_48074_cov_106.508890_6_plen_46_part_00